MTMHRSLIRTTLLALAIAAAIPTLANADTTVSVQANRHSYVYYRDHDIYYAPDTRTYYWMDRGNWRQGERLPDDQRDYVRGGGTTIELDTDRPYERHDYVVSHYKNASDPRTETTVSRTRGDNGAITTTTTTTSRRYVYYRDHDIYFAPESRTYYWRTNGEWRSGAVLPHEAQGYVTSGGIDIELDTDRPYDRDDYVREHYRNAAPTVTTERSYGRDGSTRTTTTTTQRTYVYYADRDIYFAPETRTYYWRDNGDWRSGSVLPRRERRNALRGGFTVQLDTDRPYDRHDYVVAQYRERHHRDHRDHDDDHDHDHRD